MSVSIFMWAYFGVFRNQWLQLKKYNGYWKI